MKRFFISPLRGALGALLLVSLFTGCGKKDSPAPTPTSIEVTGVTLNKTTLSLAPAATETLTATVTPDNATNKTVTWSSDKTAAATVDATGKVTAVAAGTAVITAKAGSKTATCTVTVAPIAVTSIILNKTTLSLAPGGTETLTATVVPSNATVTWSSNQTAVATVDANGKITAGTGIANETAVITAKAGDKTATCNVTVAAVNGITLTVQKLTTPVAPNKTGASYVWFAYSASAGKVFYSSASNVSGETQFFLAYNIATNNFSTLVPNTQIAAAGYESRLVSDGTSLYYIASSAVKYSIGNNTWSTTAISYPTTAHDNNGETGILFKGARIYFLGGRTASTQFKYYSFNTNSWFNAADYPVAVQTNDLVAVDNAVYALGGDANHKKFSSYTETSNAWTALPDLPFAAKNSATDHTVAAIVSGSKGMLLFALVGTKIYVYDTQSAIWKATPIETNIVGQNLNLFSDGSVLYIASRTTTGDFSLHKLTVN